MCCAMRGNHTGALQPLDCLYAHTNYKQAQASLMKELEGMLEAKVASLEVRCLSLCLRRVIGLHHIPSRPIRTHPPSTQHHIHQQTLHHESAASARTVQQLQETLGAKESECASGLQRIGDLEQQLRLLRRGREEDAAERCVRDLLWAVAHVLGWMN